jgi:hypothetical protein
VVGHRRRVDDEIVFVFEDQVDRGEVGGIQLVEQPPELPPDLVSFPVRFTVPR